MPIFGGFFDAIRDFFAGNSRDDDDGIRIGSQDDDDEEDTIIADLGDDDGEKYLMEDPEGEPVGLPTVDYETGIEYCSGAPDGILKMVLVNEEDVLEFDAEPEYEIWRTYVNE